MKINIDTTSCGKQTQTIKHRPCKIYEPKIVYSLSDLPSFSNLTTEYINWKIDFVLVLYVRKKIIYQVRLTLTKLFSVVVSLFCLICVRWTLYFFFIKSHGQCPYQSISSWVNNWPMCVYTEYFVYSCTVLVHAGTIHCRPSLFITNFFKSKICVIFFSMVTVQYICYVIWWHLSFIRSISADLILDWVKLCVGWKWPLSDTYKSKSFFFWSKSLIKF